MATGWVQSVIVIPNRKVRGEVEITSPYSRKSIFTGTVAAAASHLVANYPRFVPSLAYATELCNRAREIRGAIRGVGYVEPMDTIAI